MKLKEIYELAIKEGIAADPRGKEEVEKALERVKKKYDSLEAQEREFFDEEKLRNPYSDTRILTGDPNTEVRTVLAGVDMEIGEVLLADRFREKGNSIDLLVSHHPEGKALATLSDVMFMQADIWHKQGVPINVAESLINRRMKEVFRLLMPINHNRAIDVAKLLDIPFICVHTPSDNLVTSFLQKSFDEDPPYTLKDVVYQLRTFPEYKEAAKEGAGPNIQVGAEENRAGRVMVDMTGGTEGPKEALEKLAAAGVGTLVGMHMGEKIRKEAEKNNINVVIAGHMASDSMGMNLYLDRLEKKGIKITPCSGLKRVSRAKQSAQG